MSLRFPNTTGGWQVQDGSISGSDSDSSDYSREEEEEEDADGSCQDDIEDQACDNCVWVYM